MSPDCANRPRSPFSGKPVRRRMGITPSGGADWPHRPVNFILGGAGSLIKETRRFPLVVPLLTEATGSRKAFHATRWPRRPQTYLGVSGQSLRSPASSSVALKRARAHRPLISCTFWRRSPRILLQPCNPAAIFAIAWRHSAAIVQIGDHFDRGDHQPAASDCTSAPRQHGAAPDIDPAERSGEI